MFKNKISSDTLFRVLFQVIFWIIWIGWPFFNPTPNQERDQKFMNMIHFFTVLNIPLFYLNLYFLMPKFFKKVNSYMYYIIYLGIIIVFVYLKNEIRVYNGFRGNPYSFSSIIPTAFVALMSLTYGILTRLTEEERVLNAEAKERLQTELSFLRSQISPHFIFNILNSIVYLINSKPEIARNVTIKLSELMRYMLYNSDNEKVTLDVELNYLSNYIELQKIRFEDDVRIEYEEAISNRNLQIEPMLLIPFVENAFKHGVGLLKNPKISVSMIENQGVLNFKVKNSISKDKKEFKDESSGIGLKNITRRLELLYTKNHQIIINNDDKIFEIDLQLKLN